MEPREEELAHQSHTASGAEVCKRQSALHRTHDWHLKGCHYFPLFWPFSLPGMLFQIATSYPSLNLTFSMGTALTAYLKLHFRICLVVQWFRTALQLQGDTGSVPGQRTKMPCAAWYSQKKKKSCTPPSHSTLSCFSLSPTPNAIYFTICQLHDAGILCQFHCCILST